VNSVCPHSRSASGSMIVAPAFGNYLLSYFGGRTIGVELLCGVLIRFTGPLANETLGTFTSDSNTLTLYVTATITKQSVQLGIEPEGKYLTNKD
jgi:hypothetical protein